ncbi:tRNA (adenosine(37)-N6)-threonylcarbamoyltransferase complex transferase subunit TsaD, partial [Streptantibioticus parmotrematis]
TDNGAMIAAVGDLLVRAGAEPAPWDVSIDPSAPLEHAALHPVAVPAAPRVA